MAKAYLYDLTDTWNAGGTTFTAIKMNATDTASAAASMLIDLQIGGTTQFHVLKSGAVHTKRSNYNITNTNAASILVSNYSLTGSDATSMFDLAGTWNTSGTPTALKLNVTDTASAAGSLLIDLQVGGTSQFKVAKGGRITAQTLTIGLGGQTAVATNTALGFETLNSASLSGTESVGVGYRALLNNTTGNYNTAVGAYASRQNTTGINNAAVGGSALQNTTTGGGNTAMGAYALLENTTGFNNSAYGTQALNSNNAGAQSSAFGNSALERFVSTGNQTAIGYRALRGGDATPANNTGVQNIAIGFQAGDAITTGNTNLVIGYDIDVDSATDNNQINIANRYFHNRLRHAPVTVANLIAAATIGAGARAFVSDALAPVFGSAVTGGGAVNVPVYSTGAAWFVG